ncbi:MAG: hypothetical protein Q8Q36_02820 [bacterium]|nr:hypothetical protein [bacterium]
MTSQLAAPPTSFPDFLSRVNTYLLNPLVGLIFAVALAYFIWGVFVFIQNSDNDAERKNGQQHMLWGVIGMFIMVAVYGILNVITGTFGLPPVR